MIDNFLLPTVSLAWREFVSFFRSPGHWIASIATPLVLWGILALGFESVATALLGSKGNAVFAYFFPSMILLMVVFSSIFAAISLIEDRRAGFLQGVLVSPAPRTAIVLGKVIGGTCVAMVQAVVLFALSPLAGVSWTLTSVSASFGSLALIAAMFSALSFWLAWRSESVQSFHSIMNLVIFPMWLLSGAFFSSQNSPALLQLIIKINPLYYGYTLFATFAGSPTPLLAPVSAALFLTLGFLLLFLAMSVREVSSLAAFNKAIRTRRRKP